MKVLILVQSVKKEPYIKLRKVQEETWDSISHASIKTLYYYPDIEEESIKGKDMKIRGYDNWGYMYMQAMKAFRNALTLEWDFLFKTDNSAYIVKSELYKLLTRKPSKRLYGGHRLDHPTTGPFLWGEGVVFSRDVVEMLVDEYIMNLGKRMGVEDAHIGAVLREKLDWDETMIIPTYDKTQELAKSHIYRCKTSDNIEDWITHMRDIYHQSHKLTSLSREEKKRVSNMGNPHSTPSSSSS